MDIATHVNAETDRLLQLYPNPEESVFLKAIVDHQVNENLFPELIDIDCFAPEMPGTLAHFDSKELSRGEKASEALTLLTYWIRSARVGLHLLNQSSEPKCLDRDLANAFFPDHFVAEMDADDYGSPAHLAATAKWNIETALAKQACSGCPMRAQCLALSMGFGPGSNPRLDEEGIFGGWARGARESIFNEFQDVRRRYERGIREEREGVPMNMRTGMSRETRTEIEAAADRLS